MWPDSADVLRDVLRRHGLQPHRVSSPESAWQAFRAFLRIVVDADRDEFALSWGRHEWSGGRPTLTFVRRLAVDASQRWQLSFDMVFQERPAYAEVGELNTQTSGFYPARLGPGIDEALWEVEHYPTLRAMWTSSPLHSTVSLGSMHPRVGDIESFGARQMAAYLEYRAEHG
jgi:hypothetical protein